MKQSEKELRKDIRFEIRARKLLLKKLESLVKRAAASAEKQIQKRKKRWEEVAQYKSYEEAQEAYGCAVITQEEFFAIADLLEAGEESVKNDISAEEAARDILNEFVSKVKQEIRGLEWDLLPEKEKEKIRASNAQILERRRNRENKSLSD